MPPVILPRLVWRRSPNYSQRLSPVRLVVVHRPVGSYAGAVEHLCQPATQASAHVVVRDDGLEATQLVAWANKAWACVSFNSASDNIETPDAIWHPDAEGSFPWQVCARIVAFRLHERGLPAHWVRGEGLLHAEGLTRHLDLGIAGGGHTDPTEDRALWRPFVAEVAAQLKRGGFRRVCGR